MNAGEPDVDGDALSYIGKDDRDIALEVVLGGHTMTKIPKDIRVVGDRDLDEDPITLPDGTVLDEEHAAASGDAVAARAARRRGRPSLTAPGVHSPHVSSRVTPDLRASIDAIAEREGVGTSEVVRRALEKYVSEHV